MRQGIPLDECLGHVPTIADGCRDAGVGPSFRRATISPQSCGARLTQSGSNRPPPHQEPTESCKRFFDMSNPGPGRVKRSDWCLWPGAFKDRGKSELESGPEETLGASHPFRDRRPHTRRTRRCRCIAKTAPSSGRDSTRVGMSLLRISEGVPEKLAAFYPYPPLTQFPHYDEESEPTEPTSSD